MSVRPPVVAMSSVKGLRGRAKSVAATSAATPKPPRYYVTFVEDPATRTPFAVVPASKIMEEAEAAIGQQYLSQKRRKRSYPTAICPLFKFPCRIFAKAEARVTVLRLNKLVTTLNEKFKLLVLHVDVEKAYSSLLEECPNKVKEGIEYMTGAVTNKRARKAAPADTATSHTDTAGYDGSSDDGDDKEEVDESTYSTV